MKSNVGILIKELRESVGISQRLLSRLSGVNNSSISKIEKGGYCPSMIAIIKIADSLNVDISYFLDEEKKCSVFMRAQNFNAHIANREKKFYTKYGEIDKLEKWGQEIVMSLIKTLTKNRRIK